MARWLLPASLLVVLLGTHQLLQGNPPKEDAGLHNALALQQAMEQARHFMLQGDSKKAVDALEEQLARVNGHAGFLRMLREAYRSLIKDLWLAQQGTQAQRYLERLCILEPAAAKDPTLRPPDMTPAKTADSKPTPKSDGDSVAAQKTNTPIPLPNFALHHLKGKKEDAAQDSKPAVARGKIEDPKDDPFSLANQRNVGGAASVAEGSMYPASGSKLAASTTSSGGESERARRLLGKAEQEFSHGRFTQAKYFFDQAYQADPGAIVSSRERWAYCMLSHVVEQLKQTELDGKALASLKQQVHGALVLAPKLKDTGHKVLKEIDQRGKEQPSGAATQERPETTVAVKHAGRNSQGWLVAETAHFRVFHTQSQELAEKVARIAEDTRRAMFRKWFGGEGVPWNPKCELILHATGADYHRMTGESPQSPGHTRIERDPSGQRVVGRRMDLRCDVPALLEAILPHETTHVVLAGMFDQHHVPRWADEGIAVLTEPGYKVEQHRRNALKCYQDGTKFTAKELVSLHDYPQPARIPAFYAQSVCLVQTLVELRDPQTVTQFVRDGLRQGYDAALQRHYGMNMTELEQRFRQRMLGEGQRVAAQ
ncbi:MAG: hypothetical protein L0Y72_31210 [Gemmataceae bacterium]|nr:hypothetical protein [Gemmataceae bacterium]